MAEIPSGGGGGVVTGGSGSIRIANITPQAGGDVVDNRLWQDAGTTVLQSCRTTSLDLNFHLTASFPKITIAGNPAELTLSADGGHYSGVIPITLAAVGTIVVQVITPDGDVGTEDEVTITFAAPPEILALSFTGGYPGAQTEVAEGQTYNITVTADKSFNRILVADQDAGDGNGSGGDQLIDVTPGTGPTVVSITIANRGTTPQLLPAHVRVRDTDTGALSPSRATNELGGGVDGVDVVTLNDLYPTVDGITKGGATGHVFGIVYPGGQQALKGSETASITALINNFNSVVYSSPGSQLDISPAGTYSNPKVVTRIGGSYNVSSDNFRITATRAANGTSVIVQGVVKIADVAPTITVSTPAARLRSGGNNGTSVQSYTITLSSNQPLLNAPILNADSGGSRGTFSGSWSGGPSNWTRSLQVSELVPDEKGTFTWEGLVATGLAGLVQNTVGVGATYTLGGFVARDLTFAAYATTTSLGTSVETFSKLTAGIFTATNQPALRQPIGTPPPVVNGYTVDATGVNPTTLIWLDTVAAATNSTGTAKITNVQETV